MTKSWYSSKTLWLNVIAIAGILLQSYTGYVIDAEKQVVILGAVNLVLRMITKGAITW